MKLKLSAHQKNILLLILFIFIGLLLRLPGLGANNLWFDEAVSYLTAELPLNQILNNTIQSSHPPLYYLLLHFWLAIVPDSDGALRLLSLVFGILLIPAVYLLAQELFSQSKTALWAALLATLSPFMTLYSHELRMYTLLALLVTLGTLFFLKALRENENRWWALFFIFFLLAIYTHLFAWLPIGAVGLYTLIRKRQTPAFPRIVLIIALLIILFIPWILTLLGESQSDLGSARPFAQGGVSTNPLKPLTTMAFLLFGQSTQFAAITGISLFLTLSLLVIFLLDGRKAIKENSTAGLLLPGLAAGLTIGLPVLVFLVRPFFLPERTLAAAVPYLFLILAWGAARPKSPLPYLVGGSAVFMLISTLLYLTGDPIKPPYREAMAFLDEQRQSGDAVLHTSDGSYFPALRYVDFENQGLLWGDPDPRKPLPVYEAVGGEIWTLEETASKGYRLWLVVALEHSKEWQIEQTQYFDQRYPLLGRYDFGEINVLLFDLNTLIAQVPGFNAHPAQINSPSHNPSNSPASISLLVGDFGRAGLK